LDEIVAEHDHALQRAEVVADRFRVIDDGPTPRRTSDGREHQPPAADFAAAAEVL